MDSKVRECMSKSIIVPAVVLTLHPQQISHLHLLNFCNHLDHKHLQEAEGTIMCLEAEITDIPQVA